MITCQYERKMVQSADEGLWVKTQGSGFRFLVPVKAGRGEAMLGGRRDKRIPEACWPLSLAKSVRFWEWEGERQRDRERPCLKEKGGG